MSNAVLKGNASGTGTVTLETPNTNSDRTISLPDVNGTVVLTDVAGTVALAATGSNIITASTNGTERMRIDAAGNVLVGTTSTTNFVDRMRVIGTTNGVDLGGSSSTGVVRLRGSDTGAGLVDFTKLSQDPNSSPFYNGRIFYDFTNNFLTLNTNGTERMRITAGGEVFIAGTTDRGAFNLQCNGTGVWGAGAYTNGSDARIKEDIAPIDSGLDVVTKLNPVTYRYKEDWSKDQSTQTGFIAQELLVALEGKNYVDGVVTQGGEYMSVAYQNIIPILTKAIQELKAELDATKAEVAALKGAQ